MKYLKLSMWSICKVKKETSSNSAWKTSFYPEFHYTIQHIFIIAWQPNGYEATSNVKSCYRYPVTILELAKWLHNRATLYVKSCYRTSLTAILAIISSQWLQGYLVCLVLLLWACRCSTLGGVSWQTVMV